jgi:hypothetical protein
MAKNKVAFEVVVTSKGFKVVQQEQGKLAASLDKTDKKTKNLNKTQDKHYGRQKQGLIQTANSTKNFSKLSQTIDGGGSGTSLVGAYATLAANVFAASAAFNALSRAAEFEKLREGLEIVGNQSGRTLSILADNLREATGMALSLEQAMSAAAIGISGGFGERELEGLAKVAKGAALTLGRSLPDAFDRLTRGAIKLEPEILDELGIMVRLDDAVEKYAAQLGKSVGSLTQMERRQAFMNEILEQGTAKFGDIAEAVDPTPYQKLGAAFGDLTKNIFTFFNETLGLNVVVGILANSTTALGGAMLIFGSTIATQIVPALGQMAEKTAVVAESRAADAKLLKKNADNEVRQLRKTRKEFTLGSQGYINARNAEKGANASLQDSINKLEVQRKRRQANLDKDGVKNREQKKAELLQIEQQIALEKRLNAAQKGRGGAQALSVAARSDAIFQKKQARTIAKFTRGEIGLGAALAANAKEFKKKKERILSSLEGTNALTTANGKLKLMFQGLTKQLKILTTAFIRFLPIIGAVVVAIGLAVLAFDKLFNTAERKEYNKTMKELDKILEGLPDKAREYNKALAMAGPASAIQQRATTILSNQISEINDKMEEAIVNRNKLANSNPFLGSDSGVGGLSAEEQRFLEGQTVTTTTGFSYEIAAGNSLDKLETLLGTRLPALGDKSKKALSSFFKIDQSAEVSSLKTLLTSDIPAYAEAARKSLDPFIQKLAEGDVEGAIKIAGSIVGQLTKQFGDLGGAVTGFATALQDSEKVSSQFIQKFLPKTQVTEILSVFTTLENGLKGIKEEADKALGSSIEQTAAQLSGVQASTGTLLGGTFLAAQKDFNKAKADLDAAEAALKAVQDGTAEGTGTEFGAAIVARRKFAKEEARLAKEGKKAITDTRETLKTLLEQEVLRKGTLEKINSLKKVEKSLMGQTAGAGIIQNTIAEQTLQLRKDDFNIATEILAKELGLTDAQREQGVVLKNLKDKRDELVKAGEKDKEIAQIDIQLQEAKNIQLQNQLNSAQAIANIENAKIAVLQTEAKLLDRINKFENDIFKTLLERRALEEGRTKLGLIDTLTFELEVEQQKIAAAKSKAQIEQKSARVQKELLIAQLKAYDTLGLLDKEGEGSLSNLTSGINKTFADLDSQLEAEIASGGARGLTALEKLVQQTFGKDLIGDNITEGLTLALANSNKALGNTDSVLVSAMDNLRTFGDQMADMFGEDGAIISSLSNLIATIGEIGPTLRISFAEIAKAQQDLVDKDGNVILSGISQSSADLLEFSAVASAFSTTLSSLASSIGAYADMKTSAIDKAIEKEEKLDGKSAESVQRIQEMEKKKTAIQKKAFEQQKKLQIASAIAATASAAAQAFEYAKGNPIIGGILAGLIIAAGMAQVAIIRKQQFNGGGAGDVAAPRTALSIGSRGNSVDVSQRASAGETAYLRGGQGVGTNANNFTPGAAMGRKGYADGADGITVGERGPEVITAAAPIDITPNYALGSGTTNVNFNISAVDGASVQNMLNEQQGNIIAMIRQAANDNGEGFLESVDPTVYGGTGG